MPLSYGKFLERLSLSRLKPRNVDGHTDAAAVAVGQGSIRCAPLMAASAAAESLREHAVVLPDVPTPRGSPLSDPQAAQRLESLLACLWQMTEDLALIRAEFPVQATGGTGAPDDEPDPADGDHMDERAAIMAQVDNLERTICSIVAVVTSPESGLRGAEGDQAFIERVNSQKRDVILKTADAVRQLRLLAVQLAAAVHAYRSGLAMARGAIAKARR